MKPPYGADRATQNSDRTDRVMGYKHGGRTNEDAGTRISINVGAPQQDDKKAQLAGGLMSALAGAAKPPGGPPPGPPMSGPPPPGGMPMGMKSGGAVKKAGGGGLSSAAYLKGPVSTSGLTGEGEESEPVTKVSIKKAVGGGMTAGALSGEGRLQKTAIAKRQR